MKKEEYQHLVKQRAKKSPVAKDCLFAFLVGGTICLFGEILAALYTSFGLDKEPVSALVPITLIGIGAVLTALGVYEKLAKHAGAGTLIPITGFANAMVSPAIEFKTEGLVTGLAVKMFTVAGPVLVFGTVVSSLLGLILYLCGVAK